MLLPSRIIRPFLAVLALLVAAFGARSVLIGWDGLSRDLSAGSRLYSGDSVANWAMFGHMVSGGLVTAAIGAQLYLAGRNGPREVHVWLGRGLCLGLVATVIAGLVYVWRLGTIGGWAMSLFFSIYGVLVLLGVVKLVSHARAGQWRAHRNWALRLSCLTLAGVIYRLHYWAWDLLAGMAGRTEAFSGWFDQMQLLASAPYLLALEVWIWRDGRPLRAAHGTGSDHGHFV